MVAIQIEQGETFCEKQEKPNEEVICSCHIFAFRFLHVPLFMVKFQVKKTWTNTKPCTRKEDLKELGKCIFTILFILGWFAFMIYLAFDSKRETDSDRQILRQIYANQKLHLFGKDDLQIKLFAQKIIESISKFW